LQHEPGLGLHGVGRLRDQVGQHVHELARRESPIQRPEARSLARDYAGLRPTHDVKFGHRHSRLNVKHQELDAWVCLGRRHERRSRTLLAGIVNYDHKQGTRVALGQVGRQFGVPTLHLSDGSRPGVKDVRLLAQFRTLRRLIAARSSVTATGASGQRQAAAEEEKKQQG